LFGRQSYNHKYGLIIPESNDPDAGDRLRLRRVTKIITAVIVARLAVVLIFLVATPAPLSAGVFSSTALASDEGSTENLQTLTLLEAVPNPIDPSLSQGGGDITIVDDSALLSESGPSGTLADIEKSSQDSGRISVYVVRDGDTLSQVASMFGVSTNTIIWANDIKRGSLITPGQILVILPISGVQHEVKEGDTLKGIAKKYEGDLDEILAYNDLTLESTLVVGKTVTIPDGEVAVLSVSYSTRSTSGGSSAYDGYYLRPISGGSKSQGIHGYNGVDLATYAGAPIFAAASGDVIISRETGWNGGYGSYVVIRHNNGTQTLYAHNNNNIVSSGQYVVQGQVVGYVGSTGRSTGNHVHFEVRGSRNPF